MKEQFVRTGMLVGESGVDALASASVIVFGIGGVGSYVTEGLARAGVGRITLVDKDTIDISNINRQLPALHSTVGRPKAQVMAERVADINPDCRIEAVQCFFLPDTADDFDFSTYDYVVDAIDNVTGKLAIIEKAYREGAPVISSMGTGNKLDPSGFRISTIEKTKVCPLAKVMRKELRARGIEGVKVLYSEELPIRHGMGSTPGSISFVPSVAGLMIAGEVIRDICARKVQE
ncbi:MAG: tRNA threonylcarbamoyladenosine dehydratase [Eubacteriaceae bacterium]|nr:tRNA threonylcarbamoyladenosine dehydratase [Eubacteriaceae bacterium]